ncbi:MAG: SRPBCC family protein [Nitrospira sp. BO4]|nr:SRPBCC family protein [Nitrospira sp. BO4]
MDKRRGLSPVLLLLLVFADLQSAAVWGAVTSVAAETDRLEVAAESGGGVRATAHVLFPASPAVVQALLTDYRHWPDLFEVRMRVAELNVRDGVATVDLRIDHALMPGEHRLVTESKALPDGGLVTELKGGDFKRYHRVWRLQPAGEGNQTRADFELVVEIESMVPDWLVAVAMRQELEAHFRIVKQKALDHSKRPGT